MSSDVARRDIPHGDVEDDRSTLPSPSLTLACHTHNTHCRRTRSNPRSWLLLIHRFHTPASCPPRTRPITVNQLARLPGSQRSTHPRAAARRALLLSSILLKSAGFVSLFFAHRSVETHRCTRKWNDGAEPSYIGARAARPNVELRRVVEEQDDKPASKGLPTVPASWRLSSAANVLLFRP